MCFNIDGHGMFEEGVELARVGSVAIMPSPSAVRPINKIFLEYLNLFYNLPGWLSL